MKTVSIVLKSQEGNMFCVIQGDHKAPVIFVKWVKKKQKKP